MNTKYLVAALAIALSTPACASARGGAGGQSSELRTTIEVTNNNWSDMVVYALRNGMRYRLGMVTSMQTSHFSLPRSLSVAAGSIELAADPIGGTRSFQTGAIQVMPGQRIDFTIQNNISISSYAVWSQ